MVALDSVRVLGTVGDQTERRCNGQRPATLGLQKIRKGASQRNGGGPVDKNERQTTSALRELLTERVVVLDGAWGTMLQGAKLTPEDYRGDRFTDHPRDVTGDPDLLNLTRPDVVLDVHRQYLDAYADITTTNTFTATSIGQADYGLQEYVREMNLAAAHLARRAADEAGGRFVAGSVGPLNVTLSLSPRVDDPAYRAVSFEDVRAAYAEQIAALAEGGVDLLLIETIFDTLNAKAAITAAREVAPDLPLWISVTIVDQSGRTLSGQTVEAFWSSIEHAEPLVVGVNCSLGAAEMRPYVAELSQLAGTYTACHPNSQACPTPSASTTRPRRRPRGWSASSPPPVRSTSSAAAAARARRTSG